MANGIDELRDGTFRSTALYCFYLYLKFVPFLIMLDLRGVNSDFIVVHNRYPVEFPKISIIQYDTDRVIYNVEEGMIEVYRETDEFGNVANARDSRELMQTEDALQSAVYRNQGVNNELQMRDK